MEEAKKGRRCYETKECPLHADLEDKAKGALPKWVFIAFIGLVLALGSWREYSNAEMKKDMAKSVSSVKTDMVKQIDKLEQFIRANSDLFHQLAESLMEIKTNQKNTISNQKDLMRAIRQHEQQSRSRNDERGSN